MALTITTAFRLRNKLKEKIGKLTSLANSAEITKPVGKEENTAVFDGKTFKETISAVRLLMTTLRDFNLAIEKANTVNKEDLITLESLKAEIAFYDSIAGKFRRVEKYSYEYNSSGGRDKIELETVLDQKAIVSHLDELKKKKDEIEERLANSNFKTVVEFDQALINKLL
jgi:molybdopterin converting factor small subunit